MPFTIGGEWIPEPEIPTTPKAASGRPVKVVKERRGNATVTVILNLPLNPEKMKALCSKFKQRLGCGGAVKADKVELQGDKIDQVKVLLLEEGIKIR